MQICITWFFFIFFLFRQNIYWSAFERVWFQRVQLPTSSKCIRATNKSIVLFTPSPHPSFVRNYIFSDSLAICSIVLDQAIDVYLKRWFDMFVIYIHVRFSGYSKSTIYIYSLFIISNKKKLDNLCLMKNDRYWQLLQ